MVEIIESLPTRQLSGRVWRHMFGTSTPDRVNTRGARWNPPGVAAIYVSLERDTAIAEGQHAVDIQPLRPKARRVVYECDITAVEVVDLSAQSTLDRLGLSDLDVSSDDFGPCQRVGDAAAWLGLGGFIVPSARAAGTNVVVLVDAAETVPELTVLSSEVIFDPIR